MHASRVALVALVLVALASAWSPSCNGSWTVGNNCRAIVVGGGPAGLTEAMELALRGFKVDLYDDWKVLGGKARSVNISGTGTNGRPDLPGEHGFRILFGSYRSLPDTLSRIPWPTPTSSGNVLEQTVGITDVMLAQEDFEPILLPTSAGEALGNLTMVMEFLRQCQQSLNMSHDDSLFFLDRVTVLALSCPRRWDEQYWNYTYWDYMHASERSSGYRKFAVQALTKTLQGCQSNSSSLRGTGATVVRILWNMAEGGPLWRIFNGPTSMIWIDPMVAYLESLGVTFHLNSTLTAIHMSDGAVSSFEITPRNQDQAPYNVSADFYFSSIPAEKLAVLLTPEVLKAAPTLAGVPKLVVNDMNGVQFFLTENVEINRGHVQAMDAPWALTLVSQQQFWPFFNVSEAGNGMAKGVISIDISDFDAPGYPDGPSGGKPARECTAEEFVGEIWYQLGLHEGLEHIFDANRTLLYMWRIDDDLSWDGPGGVFSGNREPLWMEVVGDYVNEPDSLIGIPNMFLGADFVRTSTGPASMEGANESGRRAVNALLTLLGRTDFVEIFHLPWPTDAAAVAAQDLDCLRLDMGLMPIGFDYPSN